MDASEGLLEGFNRSAHLKDAKHPLSLSNNLFKPSGM